MRRFLLALLIFSSPAFAAKTIIEKINGFEVHLVDVGRGDSLGVAFFTPYGSMQDQHRMMGRAHFLEHFLHNGSVAFPGYHTFQQQTDGIGVHTNAFTAGDKTYYFAVGKQAHAKILLPVHLGMLGGLEWDEATFKKQIEAVIDEIVKQGLPREDDALHMMPLTALLPSGHPWVEVPMHGDGVNLPALTMEDMKDLYYRAYGPDAVKVVVAGNFSQPGHLEEVRAILKAHLKTFDVTKDPQGFTPRGPTVVNDPVPSIAQASGQRLVLHSESMSAGKISLEADFKKSNLSAAALGVVATYLNLQVPGSLLHKLLTELGWVTSAGFWSSQFTNRSHLYFYYEMTVEGLKHEREIEKMMFEAFSDLYWNGIPEDTFQAIKKSLVKSTEKQGRDVKTLIEGYHGILADEGDTERQLRDLDKVDQATIRGIVQSFSADQAVYSLIQPAREGMAFDARFKRHYKIEDHRARVAANVQLHPGAKPPGASYAVHLKPVDLGQIAPQEQPSFFTQSRAASNLPVRVAVDFRKDLDDAAVIANLRFNPARVEHLAALDIVQEAFTERYTGEITTISMKYFVKLGFQRAINDWKFSASGDDRYTPAALTWLIEKLVDFEPTAAELERAKQSLAAAIQSKYLSDFTAVAGLDTMRAGIDPLRVTPLQTREHILAADVSDLTGSQWRLLVHTSNKELVMVGDLAEIDGLKLQNALGRLSPKLLTEKAAKKLNARAVWNPAVLVEKFPPGRNDGSQALVRVYKGPSVHKPAEVAAFQALTSLINSKVYILNREERGLGYVHNAGAGALDRNHLFLLIYGQTEGEGNDAKVIDGWETVLRQLRDGTITDHDIEQAIQDVVSKLTAAKTSAPKIAEGYDAAQTLYFDARFDRRLAAAAQKLSASDVRLIAQKYLLDPAIPYRQLTLTDCERLLE